MDERAVANADADADAGELTLLRCTARQLFASGASPVAVGELGLFGLLVPEASGGAGWHVAEACVIAEEAGRALTPLSWAAISVAASALADSPAHAAVLEALMRGELVGVVARRADVSVSPDEATVSGALTAHGRDPHGALVLVGQGERSLYVDLSAPGISVERVDDPLDTTRDMTRITLTNAAVTVLPGTERVGAATVATLLASADCLGALDSTVERVIDYLRDRDAFGRPIASFQAIQHRLVDLTVLVAAGRALVRRAARAVAGRHTDAARLVNAAHAYLTRRCTAALDDCVQLCGGIGFTWEWPVHHAMRRCLLTAALAPAGEPDLAPAPVPEEEEPEVFQFRGRVGRVIAEHAPLETREGHRAPTSPQQEAALRRWYQTMYDEGLVGAAWPREWGGRPDHRPWHDLVVIEELIRARAPRPIDQVLLASHVLLHFGSDQQRARYLPRIRSGQDIWCQLFSEPGAGSDLAGIQARATRRDDGTWVLAGQKTWTTDGHWAQHGLALLRTSPTTDRHGGITAFVVPMDSPGLVVRPMRTIGGAFEFNDVFLDGVELSPDQVVGEVGQGWAVAMSGLEVERFTVGGNVVLLDMLLEDVLAVARPLLHRGDIRSAISDLSSQGEAAKAFITDHANLARTATVDATDAPIAKILYSETYNRIARYGTELVARYSPVPDDVAAAARRLCDAWLWSRALTISGGSSEIMRNIIARRRLKLPS
jgi:alkylation response protein AidB-like acyl-CoA dehydrogenase